MTLMTHMMPEQGNDSVMSGNLESGDHNNSHECEVGDIERVNDSGEHLRGVNAGGSPSNIQS